MRSKKKGKWIFKKYVVGASSIILCIVIIVLSFSLMIFCDFLDNVAITVDKLESDIEPYLAFYIRNRLWISTLKDIMIIVTSVTGAGLLLILVIQKDEKNNIYTDFFASDILSNPDFYKGNLTEQNALQILNSLESIYYFSENEKISDMYNHIRKKLHDSIGGYANSKYYLEYCSYEVKCNATDKYFEKHVTRTVGYKAYKGNVTIHKLRIGQYCSFYDEAEDKPAYEINAFFVDGKPIDKSHIVEGEYQDEYNSVFNQNHYNIEKGYYYDEKIKLSSTKTTEIRTEYITRTNISDIVSSFRCALPCKDFKINFNMIGDYTLVAEAFGFCDSAGSSPNNEDEKSVTIHFNDKWTFPEDGVVIVFKKEEK